MIRTLRLSVKVANEAVSSKERLEALAFAMMIKLTFVSSSVQSPTYDRLRSIFGMGNAKLKRLITNGLKYGYLKRVNGALYATPIKEVGFNEYLKFPFKTASFLPEVKCSFKHKDIKNKIRSTVIQNHIRKQTECNVTIKKASAPKNANQLRSAKRKLKRKRCKEFVCYGLSNKRLSEVSNSSLYATKVVMKGLVSFGILRANKEYIETDINPKEFSSRAYAWMKETGHFGHFFGGRKGNKEVVYCRLANSYTIVKDNIKYLNKASL